MLHEQATVGAVLGKEDAYTVETIETRSHRADLDRNAQMEDRTGTGFTLCGNLPAEESGELPDDGQAEPAARTVPDTVLRLDEGFEDSLQIDLSQADPGVLHGDREP